MCRQRTESALAGVWHRRLVLFPVAVLALLLAGCNTVAYYGQAISGQLGLLSQRRNIDTLLANSATDPRLQAQLREIQSLRAFAAGTLHLPVGKQYATYVDLERPFVIWNVFAAPEFSLRLRNWCYPVAGCVSYRGYFTERGARNFAQRLRRKGLETYVGGVAAYSTLGWFADPVLNTFVERPPQRLAALLFHELAHQVVYVKGDTTFNESFATAVEQEGVQRWLRTSLVDAERRDELLAEMGRDVERQAAFVALVQEAVRELERVYASVLDPVAMRDAKAARLAQLSDDYASLKAGWGGYDGYDAWFAGDLNNARLATVSTYNDLVPAFQALLAAQGGDLRQFYRVAEDLARLPQAERHTRLAQCLAGMGC